MSSRTTPFFGWTARALAAVALALVALGPAAADDRNLVSASATKPYIFLLLDTSGSMNWTPRCTQAQYDTFLPPPDETTRTCNYVCPAGDCAPPRYADDPASKFRQAKEALYEVISSIDDDKADFGFATFDQDALIARRKHWLYRLQNPDPNAANGPIAAGSGAGAFVWPPPETPAARVFGDTFGLTFSEGGLTATSSYGGVANPDCDTGGSGNNEIGCYARNPADLYDTTYTPTQADPYWELQRVLRIPKLGSANGDTVFFYVRHGGVTYWIQYAPVAAQTISAPTVDVSVTVSRCTNPSNNCDAAGERSVIATKVVRFERVGDFLMWTYGLYRRWDNVNSTSSDYFQANSNYNQVTSANNTCDGIELNTDATSDRSSNCTLVDPAVGVNYNPCNIKYPTIQDPVARDTGVPAYFDIGDRIPADWDPGRSLTLKQEILRHLAPNLSLGEADPFANNGFGQARYLNDLRSGTETFLRVRDPNLAGRQLDASFGARPLIANGSTPLGGLLGGFASWYCGPGFAGGAACDESAGWSSFAALGDELWGCRTKYVIMLTDGDETCGTAPCPIAARLRTEAEILTYVVGFGVPGISGNQLECIAHDGGTGDPLYPQNKQELVRDLTNIFHEIIERTSTFASAAVPTVQATVADKVFVSNFTPVKESSIWAGSLYGFLKPLPLTLEGAPDITVPCSLTVRSKCFLWDAGDTQTDPDYSPSGLLVQAPDQAEITAGNLRIGPGPDERRVFYRYGPQNSWTLDAAASRRWFRHPDAADELDFWSGLGLVGTLTAAQKRAEANAAVDFLLVEKLGTVTDPNTFATRTLHYLMGDTFHSDPIVVDGPRDSTLYRQDPYGTNLHLCTPAPANDPPRVISPSYREFVVQHACRRKMLIVGANDGQLHVFDAGTWTRATCDINSEAVGFSDGTGRELFSFIPRAVLPTVDALKVPGAEQDWSVDGRTRVADVFIDPLHIGTPTCLEREWRTVAIGSLREGGRSYFALDITQPDTYTFTEPETGPSYVPDNGAGGYVPTCLDGGASCGTLPFPSVLWEFTDTWNEDNVGLADLGETWSGATVGRIRVCTSACGTGNPRTEDRWVAVVGGGLGEDPTNATGNWLYMIDVETGKTLYKRLLSGSAPAPASAVDTDQDGYLDRVYVGTTAGLLYKVDLGRPNDPLPLTLQVVRDYSRTCGVLPYCEETVTRVATSRARPFVVFSTGGRAIYQETAVIYVAKLNQYALAFGTGNRWNLWDNLGPAARFYVIVDDEIADRLPLGNPDGIADPCPSGPCATTGYRTEADYIGIDPDEAFSALTPNYLTDPTGTYLAGWFLRLGVKEKVITDPFAFSGILSFTAYDPTTAPTNSGTCVRSGTSRVFVVGTTNASPYVFPDPNDVATRRRYWVVDDFTTQPYVEQSATKNPGGGSDLRPTSDQLCTAPAMETMREELKKLYPADCKFNNTAHDVKTIRSDTGLVCIAPVPECVVSRHWKEY